MEALQTEDRIEQAEREVPIEPVAVNGTARKMFRYSQFVDVGDGAAECEHARDGQCENVEHFHAWCRLPNPYQHEDIRKKGLAAKARKIRELKDPNSDASIVLDETLAPIGDPLFKDTIIDEMLAREWAEDYLEAQQDVEEREEFEHIDQDREEFNRLKEAEGELSEDEQSDEFKRLVAHTTVYVDAIRDRMEELHKPKRDELRERSIEDLVGLVRGKRVEEESDRVFIDTYNAWMWFVGTFKVDLHPTLRRAHLPMWEEIGTKDRAQAGTMFGEAPEVIDALKIAFNDLQLALQKGSSGN